jgi:hypothetical protein
MENVREPFDDDYLYGLSIDLYLLLTMLGIAIASEGP